MDKSLFRIALLGAVTGLMAAVLVTLFRQCIEISQTLFLPDGRVGNYEALPDWLRFTLPVGGALLLGLAFERLPASIRSVGIVHLLNTMRFRKQSLPFANAVVQFFGGAVAIVTGQSVDREGPGVHLGAANAALVGRKMHLDEGEDTLLAAAGGAAAIAAAFNTPLAGVIFVIEVLRVRYAVNNIIPVIVAAVVGAVISRLVYGESPAFAVPALSIGSLGELPIVVVMGLGIGIIAAGFIRASEQVARYTLSWRPLFAFMLAGVTTGVLAQWSPAIMGVSYDAVDRIFHNQTGLQALVLLLLAKLVATAVSVGVRLPGGIIGPSLITGGAVGGIVAMLVSHSLPQLQGSASFYAMVGMVAMMGATLRAPLAALVALMELTGNLNIILPGMIAVVIAEITTRALVGDLSAFTALLNVQYQREEATVEDDAKVNGVSDNEKDKMN